MQQEEEFEQEQDLSDRNEVTDQQVNDEEKLQIENNGESNNFQPEMEQEVPFYPTEEAQQFESNEIAAEDTAQLQSEPTQQEEGEQ